MSDFESFEATRKLYELVESRAGRKIPGVKCEAYNDTGFFLEAPKQLGMYPPGTPMSQRMFGDSYLVPCSSRLHESDSDRDNTPVAKVGDRAIFAPRYDKTLAHAQADDVGVIIALQEKEVHIRPDGCQAAFKTFKREDYGWTWKLESDRNG